MTYLIKENFVNLKTQPPKDILNTFPYFKLFKQPTFRKWLSDAKKEMAGRGLVESSTRKLCFTYQHRISLYIILSEGAEGAAAASAAVTRAFVEDKKRAASDTKPSPWATPVMKPGDAAGMTQGSSKVMGTFEPCCLQVYCKDTTNKVRCILLAELPGHVTGKSNINISVTGDTVTLVRPRGLAMTDVAKLTEGLVKMKSVQDQDAEIFGP